MPEPETPQDAIAYVALQELATRISHHNTGKLIDDPAGYEVLKRVRQDENRHYLFYRDLVTAALEIDPSGHGRGHRPAGAGVRDARHRHRRLRQPTPGPIANAGIYDFQIHHDQILQAVVVRHWDLEAVEGLDAEGEAGPAPCLRHIEPGRQGRQAPRPPRELTPA